MFGFALEFANSEHDLIIPYSAEGLLIVFWHEPSLSTIKTRSAFIWGLVERKIVWVCDA